jgi:hypothetical protein
VSSKLPEVIFNDRMRPVASDLTLSESGQYNTLLLSFASHDDISVRHRPSDMGPARQIHNVRAPPTSDLTHRSSQGSIRSNIFALG